MDESRGGSRIVYPKLLVALTDADLVSQFQLAPEERAWAGTAARRGPSMVVLLTQLKVFQSIGRFLPLAQIPATALAYIARQLSLAAPTDVSIDPRTTYRQNSACRFQYFASIISTICVNADVVRRKRRRTPTNVDPPLAPVGSWPAILPVGEPFPAGGR